jgi:hypothetical protein
MTPEFPQHRSRAACGSGQTPDGGRSPRTRQSSGDRPARLRHLPLATPAGAEADPIFNGARRASRDQLRGCPPAALEEAGGTEGRPQPPALAEAGPTASYPWQESAAEASSAYGLAGAMSILIAPARPLQIPAFAGALP